MSSDRWLELAILLAAEAHEGQRDRSDRPYILHPLRVMHKMAGKVEGRRDGDLILAAAVLHDVVEDTRFDLKYLDENGFPARVVEIVKLLTHPEGMSYRDYIVRLSGDSDAAAIKLADLNDNLFHPARRAGWQNYKGGKKQTYLDAWFFLTDGSWPS